MPKIETFKIKVRDPESAEGIWVEEPGVGFEYRGERFFYRTDIKHSTDINHSTSGLWVCFIRGRPSAKAARKALEAFSERHGWDRLLAEIKARSEVCGS